VLTTGWPLLDLKPSGAKLKSDGIMKIDGRELYAISYFLSGAGDLTIGLYFEPVNVQLQDYSTTLPRYEWHGRRLEGRRPKQRNRYNYGGGEIGKHS
jgi:hypothetical protein